MCKKVRIGFIGNISYKSEREKYTGILRYAATHPDVLIEEFNPTLFPPKVSQSLIRHWSPDGIVISAPVGYDNVPELPGSIPIGLVDHFDDLDLGPRARFVLLPDEAKLSRTVARHFLRRHFRSFAYLGYADKPRSRLRQSEFSQVVENAGYATSVFAIPWSSRGTMTETETRQLKAFLKGLAFPCAAFVYWDYLAKQILAACSELGLTVPEQLSIIGVDNEELICENTRPTLSSVELDFQSAGYQAAERLHEILLGKKSRRPFREVAYGMSRLVERISSSDQDGSVRILTAARETIRTEACRGLTAEILARRLNISQRYLELHFKKALGTTPCAEIKKRKIEEVKRLLVQTNMPLDTISRQAGFQTLHHLQNIFTPLVGCSLKAFRERARRQKRLRTKIQ